MLMWDPTKVKIRSNSIQNANKKKATMREQEKKNKSRVEHYASTKKGFCAGP